MGLADSIAADARLYILRELAQQVDGRLYDLQLVRVLDMQLVRRTRPWVRTQLRAMQDLGAITIVEMGETMVACLAGPGRDHLEQRAVIDGITRPSEA